MASHNPLASDGWPLCHHAIGGAQAVRLSGASTVAAVNTSGVLKDVGDPQARRSDDFYVTPAWQTVAMARYVNIPKLCSVYEPCVGDGAIVRAMQRVRPKLHWFTSDIVAREPFAPTFLADEIGRAHV